MPDYNIAVEIAIEEAELGISPYEWDNCPFADIRYGSIEPDDQTVPADAPDLDEQSEVPGLFDDCAFPDIEEWMVGLSDRDLYTMRRAIDDIREISSRAAKPLPMPVLAGWIDL